jgi:hypothetical protein
VAGNIQNLCTGIKSCSNAGNSGAVGDIQSSCIGDCNCHSIGHTGEVAGNIQNSCTGGYSCYYIGSLGAAGDILSSCIADYSCFETSSQGGSKGVYLLCAFKSCYRAGRTSANIIYSNLNNCCNTSSKCAFKLEATISSVCKVRELIVGLFPYISNFVLVQRTQYFTPKNHPTAHAFTNNFKPNHTNCYTACYHFTHKKSYWSDIALLDAPQKSSSLLLQIMNQVIE